MYSRNFLNARCMFLCQCTGSRKPSFALQGRPDRENDSGFLFMKTTAHFSLKPKVPFLFADLGQGSRVPQSSKRSSIMPSFSSASGLRPQVSNHPLSFPFPSKFRSHHAWGETRATPRPILLQSWSNNETHVQSHLKIKSNDWNELDQSSLTY